MAGAISKHEEWHNGLWPPGNIEIFKILNINSQLDQRGDR